MNKIIDIIKIIRPHHGLTATLYDACMSLTFNCPPSIFNAFDQNTLLMFTDPILVNWLPNTDQYEICSGFRTYQLCLEQNIKKIPVVDISELSAKDKVKLSYFATVIPLLVYSSPSTHAKHEIKKFLETIQNELLDSKTLCEEFTKAISKFIGRKRKVSGKTAIQTFLKEITK